MPNLNNNAALNEMVTLLGGGTTFQGLTDAQLRASAVETIVTGNVSTVSGDNRIVYFTAVKRGTAEQYLVKYIFDASGTYLAYEVLDKNGNVTGMNIDDVNIEDTPENFNQVQALANIQSALNSIVNSTPVSLGQQTMSGSTSVVIASNQSNIPVSIPVTISDGYSLAQYIFSLATTNATLVKNTTGSIGAIHLYSTLTTTVVAYLKLYNKATAPIPGTDVPIAVYKIGNAQSLSIEFPKGLRFTQGIGFAITRGASPVDTAAIGLGEITGQIVYI